MFLKSIPNWVQKIFKSYIWKMPATPDSYDIFLTFDDGPHPEITPWVLSQLKEYQANATFFCIGKNVVEFPDVYQQILNEGHTVGNHTHQHLKGRKTDEDIYIADILQAQKFIDSKLFRPPYGSINRLQTKKLKELGFKIILWNIIPGDWDKSISSEKCLENIIFSITPGSIIVLHDSEKAQSNMEYVLPRLLEYGKKKNWKFKSIV
ncbi:MAG TPA: polysaccharide deacetylase family protein [Edaphocola sp.]|nr:polysaccharide deacetylase family protein [Edaphocola sp.]